MYIFRILLLGRGLYIVREAGGRQWSGVPPVLSSWEIAAGRVVASCGGRGELGVHSWKRVDVFLHRQHLTLARPRLPIT